MTTNTNRQTTPVQLFTGATVNGVQQQAEVLMERHTPKDWPLAREGLAQWKSIIQAMDAKDFEVPIQAIRMNTTTGGLFNADKPRTGPGVPEGITPTRTALGHLVAFSKNPAPQAVANMERHSTATRAMMLQDYMTETPKRNVTLRTAVKGIIGKNQERAIRAVVSDVHSKENGDDGALITQLERLPEALLANGRLRVIKEWDYTHVELVLPNKVREMKQGVVVYGRVNLKNSETKGGSFEASVGTMNLWCLNGAVASGADSTVTIRHTGDIRTRMRAGVVTVVELVDIYLEEYFQAYRQELPVPQAEAIERTLKRHKLPEATGAALQALWNVDGQQGAGHTIAGLANALTRHAQSLPVEQALDIETVAGKVIAQGLSAFL